MDVWLIALFKSFHPLLAAFCCAFSSQHCRVDEIEVQIISNIRLVLLFWLSCTHAHAHTRGCILASVSGKTICGSETGTQELWGKFREPRRNLLRRPHVHTQQISMHGRLSEEYLPLHCFVYKGVAKKNNWRWDKSSTITFFTKYFFRKQSTRNTQGLKIWNFYIHGMSLFLAPSHPATDSSVDLSGIYFVREQGVHCHGLLTWNPKLIDT